MFIVGLTGSYGMGKSTVLSMFRRLGAITLNADNIVDLLLNEKDVLEKIEKLLGKEVFNKDGALDKEKVSDLIFADDTLRHSLEDILHPLVFEKIESFLGRKDKLAIIEVPILYERGYKDRFDRIITVCTKEEIALDRLEKKGIAREKALMILKTQLPIEEKIKLSDFVIDNSGTLEETMAQVEIIYNRLLEDGDNQRS